MHYTMPCLEETLCFANIAKSNRRYVSGYDWYPALAGLIVTSYSFSTAATMESGNIVCIVCIDFNYISKHFLVQLIRNTT